MEYVIAIPTYKRANLISGMSIGYLRKCNVPDSRIHLFVSNEAEYDAYTAAFPFYTIVNTNANTLGEKSNFIFNYFPVGTPVVVMEDDLKTLVRKRDNRVEEYTDFDGMAAIGFEACTKYKTGLWGINPTDNGFYMSESVDVGLKVIAGYLYGFISSHLPFLRVRITNKHDYERTILNFIHYGSVVRINYIGQRSRSFFNEGGLQEQLGDTREAEELKSNAYLTRRFGHLVQKSKRVNRKFNNPTELLLKHFAYEKNTTNDWKSYQKLIDNQLGY